MAAQGGVLRVASVRLAGFEFLVPLDCVSHALRLSRAELQLPRADGTLIGIVMDRGRPVPLIDLRRWSSLPGAAEPVSSPSSASSADGRRPVLILRTQEGQVGLWLDALLGFIDAAAASRHRVAHASAADECFDEVMLVDDPPRPLPLLDVSRLMRLSGVWAATQPAQCVGDALVAAGPAAGLAAGPAQSEPGRRAWGAGSRRTADIETGAPMLFFRCADRWLAADCAQVLAVRRVALHQPMTDLEPGLLGITRWGTREVPVFDPLAVADLSPAQTVRRGLIETDAVALVVFLGRADQCLGLRIDALDWVGPGRRLDQDLSGLGLRRPADFLGLVTPSRVRDASAETADTALRLNVSAWLARFGLSRLTRVDDPVGARDAAARTDRWPPNRESYFVFRAGQRWAAPVTDCLALLAWDGGRALSPPDARSIRGSLVWRDRMIPLGDYAHAHGGTALPAAGAAVVLVVGDEAGQTWGWLVSGLDRLIPPNTGRVSQLTVLGGRPLSVVAVGAPESASSFQITRLHPPDAPGRQARSVQRVV